MTTTSAAVAAGAPNWKLDFVYDAFGRRVMKQVWRRNAGGTAWVLEEEMKFIYEGWNLLAEVSTLKPGSATARAVQSVRSYLWGEDLSGTETGAGGVGGLLMVRQHAAAVGESWTGWQVPCFDGNGNVLAYLDGDDGEVMSRYEYDPFGRTVLAESVARYSKTGTAAGRRVAVEAPPFRFSTKYQDRETGLVYYGFRYYAPEWGRWLSRDPIEEGDGPNLYAMVRNNPINLIDKDGRTGWQIGGPWDHDYFDPKIKVEDPFLEGFVSWFVGNGRGAVTWLALSGSLGQEKQNDYEFRTWVIKEVANAVQKELRSNPDARDLCSAEIKVYAKGHWQQITGRIAAGVTVSIALTRVGGKKGTAAATVLTANALVGDVYHQAGRVTGELNNRGINQQEAKKEFETQMQDGQAALKAYIDFLKAAATGK